MAEEKPKRRIPLKNSVVDTGPTSVCPYATRLTQEIFNDAVKENQEVFGLNETDAIKEAVHQFRLQGVKLTRIYLKPMTSPEAEAIKAAVEKLEQLQKTKGSLESVNEALKEVAAVCEPGIPQRVLAGKANAYTVLLDTYDTFTDKDVRINVLKALIALMTQQPDLLDDRGVEFLISNLKDPRSDPQLQRLILKWTKESCIKHEANRQQIFDCQIVDILKNFLMESTPIEVITEALSVIRGLTLDDDIRVDFGRSHEQARVIAGETLCSIMALFSKYRGEEQLNADIMLTLTTLIVRQEFCLKVYDAGGIDLIKIVMETYVNSDKVIRQGFKLIKGLAGDDGCRAILIKKGYAGLLKDTMLANMESVSTITAGLSAIAALTLRNPYNSQSLFDAGIPQLITEAMKRHPEKLELQRAACWAIRNMVSRSPDQPARFIQLGAEYLLNAVSNKFSECAYDSKAALRDLGCKIKFTEEWTGSGGALTQYKY